MENLAALAQFAVAEHRAGRLETAEQAYRQILDRAPGEAGVRRDLGWLLLQRGNPSAAVDQLRTIVAAHPGEAVLRSDFAHMLNAAGHVNEAIDELQKALQIEPRNAAWRYNLGNYFRVLGRLDRAVASYQAALEIAPDDTDIHLNLGAAYQELGQLAEARASFERVLRIKPDAADAWVNLGVIAKLEGNFKRAGECYQRALELDPRNSAAYNNWGTALAATGELEQAIDRFQKALEIRPGFGKAAGNLADSYLDTGRYREAVASYERAIEAGAGDMMKIKRALTMPAIIDSIEQVEETRRNLAAELDKLESEALSVSNPLQNTGAVAFYLAYQGFNERDYQSRIAQIIRRASPSLAYVAPHCAQAPPKPAGKRRLRVGFISTHFLNHTICKLNAGLIQQFDRKRFEVLVLRDSPQEGWMAEFVESAADLCITLSPQLEMAQQQVAEQELDILYYTDIGMVAYTYYLAHARLAPVQCVTWGHPLSTGIPTLDYFISSEDLEPPDSELHYTEKLVRLKYLTNYYLRPRPPVRTKSRADFGISPNAHLYVCPQSLFKLHPSDDQVWRQILERDPQATIAVIAGQQPYWTELLRQRQRRSLGSWSDRVLFVPRMPLEEFQQLLGMADLLLDPLQFGGGDTSYEGFAAGTPIVTLPGQFLRNRITYAQYRTMGVTECVARDADDYVAIAVRLATEPDWREHCRQRILAENHKLYENQAAVRELEDFFEQAVAAI